MAADNAWLSPSQGRDVLGIPFTWRKLAKAGAALLPDIDAALAPFEQSPHRGTMSSLDADAVDVLYPDLPRFRDPVRKSDPACAFRGPFRQASGGSWRTDAVIGQVPSLAASSVT